MRMVCDSYRSAALLKRGLEPVSVDNVRFSEKPESSDNALDVQLVAVAACIARRTYPGL